MEKETSGIDKSVNGSIGLKLNTILSYVAGSSFLVLGISALFFGIVKGGK